MAIIICAGIAFISQPKKNSCLPLLTLSCSIISLHKHCFLSFTQVDPIISFPIHVINENSGRLIQQSMTAFSSERRLDQVNLVYPSSKISITIRLIIGNCFQTVYGEATPMLIILIEHRQGVNSLIPPSLMILVITCFNA